MYGFLNYFSQLSKGFGYFSVRFSTRVEGYLLLSNSAGDSLLDFCSTNTLVQFEVSPGRDTLAPYEGIEVLEISGM